MTSGIINIQILPELSQMMRREHEFIARITIVNDYEWKFVRAKLGIKKHENCIPFVSGVQAFVLADIDAGKSIEVDIPFTAEHAIAGFASITFVFNATIDDGREREDIARQPLLCANAMTVDFEVHSKEENSISKNLKDLMRVFD